LSPAGEFGGSSRGLSKQLHDAVELLEKMQRQARQGNITKGARKKAYRAIELIACRGKARQKNITKGAEKSV
jgi:hypothetical protein